MRSIRKKWGENEWNIINDIEGAKTVFDAPCADVRVFGVELTCRCFGDPVKVSDSLMESPVLEPAAVAARNWKNGVWFHDAVAVSSLFTDSGMTFEKGNITVTDNGRDGICQRCKRQAHFDDRYGQRSVF